MPEQLQSIVIGTGGLTLALVAALAFSMFRKPISRDHLRPVQRLVCMGIALHVLHCAEESFTGFHLRFPEFLGLVPWSLTFFIVFNLSWVAIWLLCIPRLDVYPRIAVFPIWFLAIASTANAVVHPLLALSTGGYFPGLRSSPLVGVLGVVLLRALILATHRVAPGERQDEAA